MRIIACLVLILISFSCSSDPKISEKQETKKQDNKTILSAQKGTFTTSDNIDIYYQNSKTEGPVIVALSGMYLFDELRPLTKHFNLIGYHPRGRGESGVPSNATYAGLNFEVSDLELFRKKMGLEKMILIGQFYDAAPMLYYANTFPDRVEKMILINPLPPRESPYLPQMMGNRMGRMIEGDRERFFKLRETGIAQSDPVAFCRAILRINFKPVMYDTLNFANLKSDICVHTNETPENLAIQQSYLAQSIGSWNWDNRIKKVDCPVLIIHGKYDAPPLSGSEEWVEKLPQGELFLLEKSGHFPYAEEPDLFFGKVVEFSLQRH